MADDDVFVADFDESNSSLMKGLSEIIAQIVPKVFPNEFDEFELSFSPAHQLTSAQLKQFLSLIDDNLGKYYIKSEGNQWKISKLKELITPGLVYVWYKSVDQEFVAFLSFMMTMNEGSKDLYLYEIHLAESLQNKGLGSKLIQFFHSLSYKLDKEGCDNDNASLHLKNSGTSLTVFSDNDIALNWYSKLNYQHADYSPRDKILRNGKVLKPIYYILEHKHS